LYIFNVICFVYVGGTSLGSRLRMCMERCNFTRRLQGTERTVCTGW